MTQHSALAHLASREVASVKIVFFVIDWRPALRSNNKEANKTAVTREWDSVNFHALSLLFGALMEEAQATL